MKQNFAGVNTFIRQALKFKVEATVNTNFEKKFYIPLMRILTHLTKCGCDFYVEPSRGDCYRLSE